ncbi:Kinase [Spironucleus salmonicida]|uniref:Kinase n=1 Tax=Spironucleus salmonicida TaxID=348837 RepID=V6LFJ1_9EUKA|nr:Kinase [Spironucleus salmonicida]|eukprot:EST43310.1 Kinase [Spironucleus salmonicida]
MYNRYQFTEQILSQTPSATTQAAVNIQTKNYVLIKKYAITVENPHNFIASTQLLKRLNHQNLIQYENFYEDASHTYIVSELSSQDNLLEKILSMKYYSEDDCRGFITQIIEGLAYLHSNNIANLNLKPENLLTINNQVKLCDYALYELFPLENLLYAPGFVSKDQLINRITDFQPDIFAVGVISTLLLTGNLPFKEEENYIQSYLDQTLNNSFEINAKTMSTRAVDFVTSCFSGQSTVFDLLNDPWLTNEAPVIPLQTTQIQLKRYVAKLKLRDGSGVNASKLVQLARKIGEIEDDIEVEGEEIDAELDEVDENQTAVTQMLEDEVN